MFLRKNKKRKSEVSFEDSLSYDAEGNELHLEDVLGTDKNVITKKIEDKELEKLLYEEINYLKPRDREIMILRYGLYNFQDLTQKEIAEKLGISQSYISRIEKKVIKKLKSLSK
jgi:RNA polymerase sporulation-specific sigma factor